MRNKTLRKILIFMDDLPCEENILLKMLTLKNVRNVSD